MTDPYKILGVTREATDDEIKKAYRELARKYHPDNYTNNPLADLVEEKMKEINEAYDQIQKERSQNGYHGKTNNYNKYSGEYVRIRELIQMNRLTEAETMLNYIPSADRNGEWNFLRGCILEKKGWYFDAQKFFEAACYMDPDNNEYKDALNKIKNTANNYGGYRASNTNGTGCSTCDICSSLICADCCCECLGGDLIGCC